MEQIRLTSDPTYRAMSDNLVALHSQQRTTEEQLHKLEQQAAAARKDIRPLGAELVVGYTEPGKEKPGAAIQPPDAAEIQQLRNELARVQAAISLQQTTMRLESSHAMVRLAPRLRPDYLKLAEEVSKSGNAFVEAVRAEHLWRLQQEQNGLPLEAGLMTIGVGALMGEIFNTINAMLRRCDEALAVNRDAVEKTKKRKS